MAIGAALVATAFGSPASVAARRAAPAPTFVIRVYSAIEEHRRTLTMAAFIRAMQACTFFGHDHLSRDIAAGLRVPSGTYGATCRGPDALAPEVEISIDREQREIGVTPDFSDAVIARFAAALKTQDHAAIAATLSPGFATYRPSPDEPPNSYEGFGPEKFLAYFDHLRARHGDVTDAYCRKRRFIEPRFYTSLYNCFVTFERLPENERVWLSPSALEDGILSMEIESGDK